MAYELYYHKPDSQKLNFVGKVDNCDPLNGDIKEEQYMAVFKAGAKVSRYFVTREAGPFEVIGLNMEDGSGRFNKRLSNLVNFVMGSGEYPTFRDEYSDGDEYDDDECEDEDQCEDE
jgi:hypothetical protein